MTHPNVDQPSFKNHSKLEEEGGVHSRVYMYFFLELFLRAHITNSVNSITSYGTGRDAMYIMRER